MLCIPGVVVSVSVTRRGARTFPKSCPWRPGLSHAGFSHVMSVWISRAAEGDESSSYNFSTITRCFYSECEQLVFRTLRHTNKAKESNHIKACRQINSTTNVGRRENKDFLFRSVNVGWIRNKMKSDLRCERKVGWER